MKKISAIKRNQFLFQGQILMNPGQWNGFKKAPFANRLLTCSASNLLMNQPWKAESPTPSC